MLDQQAYSRDYYLRNREKKIAQQLARFRAKSLPLYAMVDEAKGVPCADCGQRWPPVAMDFDHVRGEKIDNVSNMVSQLRPPEMIKSEMAKCDVVCACCHRIRTFKRNGGVV